MRNAALLLLAILAFGCGGPSHSGSAHPVAHAPAPVDPWMLTCLDPSGSTPAVLWNGQIGIRIGRDGRGAGQMFAIDEYDTDGEEKIRPFENPISAYLAQGSNELARASERAPDYKQTLDMRSGVLTTSWAEDISTSTHPNSSMHITSETVMHPLKRIVAQRWTCVANRQTDMDFSGAHDSTGQTSPEPGRAPQDIGQIRIYRGLTGTDSRWSVRSRVLTAVANKVPAGSSYIAEATWVFRPSSSREKIARARGTVLPLEEENTDLVMPPSFDTVLNASKSVWTNRWKTDIEIDGPVEDQQAVRSFLFYLRSAIAGSAGVSPASGARDGCALAMSISPFGLSSDKYNGHVFWDADIWVFPALALLDPEAAKSIAEYRLATRQGAIQNQIDSQIPDKPHITEYEPNLLKSDHPKFAWESSVTGRETAPMSMRLEEHINGDVPWMLGQAAFLGLVSPSVFNKATSDASKYFDQLASRPEEAWIELTHVTSPDENHTGNNDLYTNLLAQWCMNFGSWTPPERLNQPTIEWYRYKTFKLPKDKISFLTYDNDPVRSYKQAAAVLSIYPLQYPPAEAQAKVMMERFAPKVSKSGPAMSDSLHALIWARLGEVDKAYDTWRHSWQDFTTEPFLLFAEKRNKKDTYFTTGAAGCLQTVLYGFLGIRIDSKKQQGAQWSTPLALGRILSVKPNLPTAWKSVKLKNFTVMGRRYTLIATHSGVTVTSEK